ncbi:phage baseplate protein, partial [uncultured Megasphaera sp.]|uniref:phage baseplate protein n=1 Tax=uncultured Megasphaera sp. TaxID=165188 RepID=UPI00265924EB
MLLDSLLGDSGLGFVSKSRGILPNVTEPAQIGPYLTVDVVMSRETKFDSEVSEYPVEDGFPIADHVTRKPMTLSLDVVFTPTPVTHMQRFIGAHSLNSVTNTLMQIYQAGEPVTIKMVDAIYTDMVMTSAPLPKNVDNGYCYRCQLEFTHVRRVVQRTEDVPEEYAQNDAAGKAGTTEKDGGAAFTSNIGTGLQTVEPGSRRPGINTDN